MLLGDCGTPTDCNFTVAAARGFVVSDWFAEGFDTAHKHKVTVTMSMAGETVASFGAVKQAAFKSVLASTLNVSLADVHLYVRSKARRRLGAARRLGASSTGIDIEVTINTAMASEADAVKAALTNDQLPQVLSVAYQQAALLADVPALTVDALGIAVGFGRAAGAPTASPTPSPTPSPTSSPTPSPTATPTATPTASPTPSPTPWPTASPTASPTPSPTPAPTPLTIPEAPTITNATVSSKTAVVFFNASSYWAGAITTLFVATSAPSSVTGNCTASPCTVVGLTDGQTYTFAVQAVNRIGTSVPSAASMPVRPIGVPDAPVIRNVTGGDSVATVSWTPTSNGGVNITQFRVTASPGGSSAVGAGTVLLLAGLTNGQGYTFTVVAINPLGESVRSAASAVVIPATYPGAPTLTAVVAGDRKVAITMAAGANGGAGVTQYRVTWAHGNGEFISATPAFVVSGLSNGVEYTFAASVANRVGWSNQSAASEAVSPIGMFVAANSAVKCTTGTVWAGESIACTVVLKDENGTNATGAVASDLSYTTAGTAGLTSWLPSSALPPAFASSGLSAWVLTMPTQVVGTASVVVNVGPVVFSSTANVIDACHPSPCLNGATCGLGATPRTFSCFCEQGFSGDTCAVCATPMLVSASPKVASSGGGTSLTVVIRNVVNMQNYTFHVTGGGVLVAQSNVTMALLGATQTTLQLTTKSVSSAMHSNVTLSTKCGNVVFPLRFIAEPPASVLSIAPDAAYNHRATFVKLSVQNIPLSVATDVTGADAIGPASLGVRLNSVAMDVICEGKVLVNQAACVAFTGTPACGLCADVSDDQVAFVAPQTGATGTFAGQIAAIPQPGIVTKQANFTFQYRLLVAKISSLFPNAGVQGASVSVVVSNLVDNSMAPAVTVAGTPATLSGAVDTSAAGGQRFAFTVPVLPGIKSGAVNVTITVGASTTTRLFAYTAPYILQLKGISARKLAPIGSLLPAVVYEPIFVELKDAKDSILGSTALSATFNGTAAATSDIQWDTGTRTVKFQVEPPSTNSSGPVSFVVTIRDGAGGAATSVTVPFEFLPSTDPRIVYVYPATSRVTVRADVVLGLANYIGAEAADVSVVFTQASAPSSTHTVAPAVELTAATKEAVLRFKTPAALTTAGAAAVGDYNVAVRWHSGAKSVSFVFSFTAPPPIVLSDPQPYEGSANGGTELVLDIESYPTKFASASDIIVAFSAINGQWGPLTATARALYISSSEFTEFSVVTPKVPSPAHAVIRVYHRSTPTIVGTNNDAAEAVSFEFKAANAPKLTSISPSAGFVAGGFVVTATVANFPQATLVSSAAEVSCNVGGVQVAVNSITVTEAAAADGTKTYTSVVQLQFPAVGTAGKQAVVLTSELDSSRAEFPFEFWATPEEEPSISQISPSRFPFGTANTLIAQVSNMGAAYKLADMSVLFGGKAATVTKVQVTQAFVTVFATLPAISDPGTPTVQLEVYYAGDREGGALYPVAVFNPNKPEVVLVSPSSGFQDGATSVGVLLANFPRGLTALTATFGSVAATSVTVGSYNAAGQLQAKIVSPAFLTAGTVSVTVATANGAAVAATAAFDFKYKALPTAAAAFVRAVPEDTRALSEGGAKFVVTVSGFYAKVLASDVNVKFNNVQSGNVAATVTSVRRVGASFQVGFTVPALPVGQYNALVSPKDRATNVASVPFVIYEPVPTIVYASPATGPSGTVIAAELTQLRLGDAANLLVKFDALAVAGTATIVAATDEEEEATFIEVTVPNLGDARKSVTVSIANSNTAAKAATFAFVYSPPTDPGIVRTFPTDGTTLGGDIVTFSVKNTPLADASSAAVAFGGTAATAVSAATVNGVVQVSCTTPAQAAEGVVAGTVTIGAFVLAFEFFAEAPPPPVVEQVEPSAGIPTAGGEIFLLVSNMPKVDTASQLVAKFGTTFASVSSIAELADGELEVVVVAPALAVGAASGVLYRSDLPQFKAAFAIAVFNPAQPKLAEGGVAPTFGKTTGGETLEISVVNFPTSAAASALGFTCGGKLGLVSVLLSSTRALTRVMAATPEVATAGKSTCVLSHTASKKSVRFEFEYVSPTAPTVESASPLSVFDVGGETLRVVIDNFPLPADGALAVTDIVLLFGTASSGQTVRAATPTSIAASDAEQTTFFVTTPAGTVGSTNVVVSPAWDGTVTTSFVLTYKKRPKPVLRTVLPALGLNTGGDIVTLTVANFPVVGATDKTAIAVLFGLSAATIDAIVVSTFDLTVLKVRVPVSALTGEVSVSVTYLKDAKVGVATSTFQYLGSDPVVGKVFPRKGSVVGGGTLSVQLNNINQKYAAADISAAVANAAGSLAAPCTVTAVSATVDKSMRVTLTMPAAAAFTDTGVDATVTVTVASFAGVTFAYQYQPDNTPSVQAIFPATAINAGGTAVQVTVKNFPAVTASNTAVTFGRTAAAITAVKAAGRLQYISVTAPRSLRASVMLSVTPSDASKAVSKAFAFFAPCAFATFCANKGGQIPNKDKVRDSPPASAACDFKYCMKKPPAPVVSELLPKKTLSSAGGDVLTVTIRNFPVVKAVGDVSAVLGTSAMTVDKVLASSVASTTLRVTTPVVYAAGKLTARITHLKSSYLTIATFSQKVFAQAVGNPTVTAFLPATASVRGGDRVRIVLDNAAELGTAGSVTVVFGSVPATVNKVLQNAQKKVIRLFITVPVMSAVCASDCTQPVSVTVKDRFGATKSGSFNFPLVVPVLTLSSSHPSSGQQQGGERVDIKLANAGATAAVDLAVLWNGASIAVKGFKRRGDNAKFYVNSPAYGAEGAVQIKVTDNVVSQSVTASFTYLPADQPILKSVAPATLSTLGGDDFVIVLEKLDKTKGFSVQVCGTTLDSSSSAAITIGASDAGGFTATVRSPACAAAGSSQLKVTSTFNSKFATSTVTMAAPPVVVTPARGVATGGAAITVDVWGLGTVANAAELSLSLAGSNAAITSASTDGATLITTLVFTTPASATLGEFTATVTRNAASRSFKFTYLAAAALLEMTPTTGFLADGTFVEMTVADMYPFNRPSDLKVMVGTEQVTVEEAVFRETSATISFFMPFVAAAASKAVVLTHAGAYSDLAGVSSAFKFTLPPPVVFGVHPESAVSAGGVDIELEIGHLPIATDATKFTATFGKALGAVKQILWSDAGSSGFLVTVPRMAAPGKVTCEFGDKYSSVFFDFKFTDGTMEVLTPAPGGTTVSASSAGGALLDVSLKGFPVVSAPSEMRVLFDEQKALVESATAFVRNVGTAQEYTETVMQITVPEASAGAASSMTNGKYAITVTISLEYDAAVAVTFPFEYRERMRPLRAQFASSNTKLLVVFNQEAAAAGAGANFKCDTILDAATVAKLGDGAAADEAGCYWADAFTLAAAVKAGSLLKPGASVALQAGVAPAASAAPELTSLAGSIAALSDPKAPLPTAAPSGPESLGFCDPLELDGSGSVGDRLAFRWTCANDVALNNLLAASSQAAVELDSESLRADYKYEILLTVTDFMGSVSAPTSLAVTRSSLSLPKLSIEGSNKVEIAADEEFIINANADFSSCSEASELAFAWTAVAPSNFATFTASGRMLRLPPGALTPGQTYVFRVTGAPLSAPQASGSATLTVTALVPPLIAAIADNDRTVSSLDALELDGAASNDPAGLVASGALQYTWSCTKNRKPCRKADHSALALGTAAKANILANAMSGGTYVFGLKVATATGRSAHTSVTIKVVKQSIPAVRVVVNKPRRALATGLINAGDKVVLKASSNKAVSWTWTISPSKGLALTDPKLVPLGLSARRLVLKPGLLKPGTTYTITASGYEAATKATGVAAAKLYVNVPPSSGTCAVTPATGVALTTVFSVICPGWRDDKPAKLNFAFGLYSGTGAGRQFTTVQPFGTTNKFSTMMKEPGTTSIGVYVQDSDGGKVLSELAVTVTDAFAGLTGAALQASVGAKVDGQLKESLQKGDASGAMNQISGLSGALSEEAPAPAPAAAARRLLQQRGNLRISRRLSASTGLGPKLLTNYKDVLDKSLITASTVDSSVTAFASIAALAEEFSVSPAAASDITTAHDLVARLLTGNAHAKMDIAVGSKFVTVLGRINSLKVRANVKTTLGASAANVKTLVTKVAASIKSDIDSLATSVAQNIDEGEPAIVMASSDQAAGDTTLLSLEKVASSVATAAGKLFTAGTFTFSFAAALQAVLPASLTAAAWTMPTAYLEAPHAPAAGTSGLSIFDNAKAASTPPVALTSLAAPISLDLPINASIAIPECRYWSTATNSWAKDGLTTTRPSAGVARCATTHLTEFTVMAAPDSQPPTVAHIWPLVTGVAFPATLRVVFDEPVMLKAGYGGEIKLWDGARAVDVPAAAISGANTNTLVIDTTNDAFNAPFSKANQAAAAYEVRIPDGAVTDLSPLLNAIATASTKLFTASFTIDTTAPTLSSIAPGGAALISTFPALVRLTFSEAVRVAGGASSGITIVVGGAAVAVPGSAIGGNGTTVLAIDTTHVAFASMDKAKQGAGAYSVAVADGAVFDTVTPANIFRGNALSALAADTFTLDTVRPTLVSVAPLLSQAFPGTLTLAFSEKVLLGPTYGPGAAIQVSDGTNAINVSTTSISGAGSNTLTIATAGADFGASFNKASTAKYSVIIAAAALVDKANGAGGAPNQLMPAASAPQFELDITTLAVTNYASPAPNSAAPKAFGLAYTLPEAAKAGTLTLTISPVVGGEAMDAGAPRVVVLGNAALAAGAHTITFGVLSSIAASEAAVLSVTPATDLMDAAAYSFALSYRDEFNNPPTTATNAPVTFSSGEAFTKVAMSVELAGLTVATFTALKQAQFRTGVAATIAGVTADMVRITSIADKARRRLGEAAAPRRRLAASLAVGYSVVIPGTGAGAAATAAAAAAVASGAGFIAALATQLANAGLAAAPSAGATAVSVVSSVPSIAAPLTSTKQAKAMVFDISVPVAAKPGSVKLTFTPTSGDAAPARVVTLASAYEAASSSHKLTLHAGNLATAPSTQPLAVSSVSPASDLAFGAVYGIELSYQDAAGNPAFSSAPAVSITFLPFQGGVITPTTVGGATVATAQSRTTVFVKVQCNTGAFEVPADGSIDIVFPAEFDTEALLTDAVTNLSPASYFAADTFSVAVDGAARTVSLKRSGGAGVAAIPGSTALSFMINKVVLPGTSGTTAPFELQLRDGLGALVASDDAVAGVLVQKGKPVARNLAVSAKRSSASTGGWDDMLLPLPGWSDGEGSVVTTITSLPAASAGALYQLDQNFDAHGVGPMAAPSGLITAPNTVVTGSRARIVYRPAARATLPTATFQFTVTDAAGQASAAPGTVTVTGPEAELAASTFDTGVDGWKLGNNGLFAASAVVAHEPQTYDSKLSYFISGADKSVFLQQEAGSNGEPTPVGDDREQWSFVAPAKFLGDHASVYGGSLDFAMQPASADLSAAGAQSIIDLVTLQCASCLSGAGLTLVYRLGAARGGLAEGATTAFSIKLTPGAPAGAPGAWLKDPRDSLAAWAAPSDCEMAEALSAISSLRVLGDLSKGEEEVFLDSVKLQHGGNGKDDIPVTCYATLSK